MNIKTLIGETTEYDKKQAVEIRKPKSWCKSVSAFANGSGGSLIFGIADDGGIVGLDNPDSDAEKSVRLSNLVLIQFRNLNFVLNKWITGLLLSLISCRVVIRHIIILQTEFSRHIFA
ncbi:MAG: ATP-binding protein [Lachnospiraceae bacterium]|nr:ATP-binding protein [Candidatus Minthocola equi]